MNDNQSQGADDSQRNSNAYIRKRLTMMEPARKYSDFSIENQNASIASSRKKFSIGSDNGEKKNFRKTLLRLETAVPKSKLGFVFNPLMRKDSMESIDSPTSRDVTPEGSPRSSSKPALRGSIPTFSIFQKLQNPSRKSSMAPMSQTVTEQADDKYFHRMKSPNSNSIGAQLFTRRATETLHENKSPSYASRILVTSPDSMMMTMMTTTQQSKPKKFYSTYRKKIVLKDEAVIDKPVASTITIENLGIKERLQRLITTTEVTGRTTTTMRNLHEFLELIQNMAQLMKASLDTFRLVQSSVEEVSNIAQLLSKHPSRESILKICNWVHLSRCYELNLKQIDETSALDGMESFGEKPFDEVQINNLAMFLISYIQDFEKLLNISKQKITQEASIREKDVIPRTIRQADLICQCISEMLIDDFRSKKGYLTTECKDLVAGFMVTNRQVRSDYKKIREKVEENLDVFKMMYHKVKNYEKKIDGYFEKQMGLKSNTEALAAMGRALNKRLLDIQAVEQNVKVFSGKFTQGIETLKRVLSFKLKVENVETLFQMPQIVKKLQEYLDLLSNYFIRAISPTDTEFVEVYEDLMKIPPIKTSFSLFVSYFEGLLNSRIYHELFSESFTQLKAINDTVNELYSRADEQFETFVKSYHAWLMAVAQKHKRGMKNEYWKILTWSDFSNNQGLEVSIAKVTNSVKIIKESLEKSKLIRKYNYKDVIEKNESLEENMKIWNEEVQFTENLLKYLEYISNQVLNPLVTFNSEYENSKPLKARFDCMLLAYIKLRNNQSFLSTCKTVANYVRGRQHDERQDFLRDFEDSMLRYHMETFFKSFFKKLQLEFKKHFANMLVVIPSDKFRKFKDFITSCAEVIESLCQQPTIARLPQLCNLFLRRVEDLQLVTFLMEQVLFINSKEPTKLTSEDEANIRSAPQSTLFKFLLESIHSYEALHGKLNLNYRANELESQMQKLEDEVARDQFDQEDIENRLNDLKERAEISMKEVQEQSPTDIERSAGKKKESSSVKTLINDILTRVGKLKRKIVKMATQKHLNQLHLLEEECKKVISTSLANRHDCYDIKLYQSSIDTIRYKVEEFKKNRENTGDEEVIEEIIEDLEENLMTLELIAQTGEKLELTITGKLETLDQIAECAESLKVLREELAEKLRKVEFLNADMRLCTQEQFRNVEIIEDYLSNAYEGIIQINMEVFNNEKLYDDIRSALSECFEVHFLVHPAFKDKIYSPDLETIKSDIELIRGGIENLKQLLRLENMALDETTAYSYEQASTLEGWLQEDLLRLFADLVVITRLYGFLHNVVEGLGLSMGNYGPIDVADANEKLHQAEELYSTLQDHEDELQQWLQKIDKANILKGKLQYIEAELELGKMMTGVGKIYNELQELRDRDMQLDMIYERKSIGDLRKAYLADLKSKLQVYHNKVKRNERGCMNLEEFSTFQNLQVTFEVFANDIEAELRKGSCHMFGTLESDFLLRLNPEKLGAKSTLKDSHLFSKLLREIRSALRRKNTFETNIGAKFQVDMVFPMIYKTGQGTLITILDIVSQGQMNIKGIVLSISKDGIFLL